MPAEAQQNDDSSAVSLNLQLPPWLSSWAAKSPAVAIMVLLYYFGEKSDGGFVQNLIGEMWGTVKQIGPAGLLAAVYWGMGERNERIRAQQQCNERTIDFIKSTNLQSASGEKIGDALNAMEPVFKQAIETLARRISRPRGRS